MRMPDARTSNGWIAWRDEGPREPAAAEDPVLLIMGLGASSRLWFRLLPWLTREHRVIVFDNRGTGSSAPVRGRLTMAASLTTPSRCSTRPASSAPTSSARRWAG